MAKINGLTGAPSGRLSNIIYSSWLGTPYARINPGKRKKGNEKEVNTRKTFGQESWDLLHPIKEVLRLTFREVSRGDRGVFAARSYMLRNAFERDAKNVSTFLPSRMLMSQGSLELSENIEVMLTADRELVFTWDPRTIGKQRGDDQLMLMAYNFDRLEAATSLGKASRRDGTATLPLDSLPEGKVHVYLSFLSFDRSKSSDSVYLGEKEI